MKRHFIFILIASLLVNCTGEDPKVEAESDPELGRATGEWTAGSTAGGFENFNSFKNFHYTFEVADANKLIDFELVSADIDVNYVVFDPLGDIVERSGIGRQVGEPYTTKTAGVFRIVVTAERRAVGKFSLKVSGTKDGLTPVPFQALRSEKQNWGNLGGGGMDKSFKNHFYTFDVTEDNTSVDIEMESADIEISLLLYDELGAHIGEAGSRRYEYILRAAKKGKYTVMAGTAKRGSVGNYSLNVFGKVQGLKPVSYTTETKKDSWKSGIIGEVAHTYTLDLSSENNSTLDIQLSSADVGVYIELQDGSGKRLKWTGYISNSEYILSDDLPRGSYRLIIRPGQAPARSTPGGNYMLSVFGQFTNLRKV